MPAKKPHKPRTWVSVALLFLALICLAQGASKALLWFVGSRAPGLIVSAENTVSARGAYWHRYQFAASDGKRYDGAAMSVNIPLYTKIQVAYLPILPDINMPAYGSYTAVMGVAWSSAGLLLLGISRLLRQSAAIKK